MQEYEALNLMEVERRWQDVRYDEDGNANTRFPYPPKFVRSEAQGELAERIRAAFAEGDDELLQEHLKWNPVYLTEKTVFGGYSEYTQENMTYLKVTCSYFEKEFEPNYGSLSLIESLLEWLDESEKPAIEKDIEEGEDTGGW